MERDLYTTPQQKTNEYISRLRKDPLLVQYDEDFFNDIREVYLLATIEEYPGIIPIDDSVTTGIKSLRILKNTLSSEAFKKVYKIIIESEGYNSEKPMVVTDSFIKMMVASTNKGLGTDQFFVDHSFKIGKELMLVDVLSDYVSAVHDKIIEFAYQQYDSTKDLQSPIVLKPKNDPTI